MWPFPKKEKRIKLSEWIIIDGFCATRVLANTDVNNSNNRIAFIEKTPRIRIARGSDADWEYGPKGQGGSSGEDPNSRLYGFYPPSREWCDKRLIELGYEL